MDKSSREASIREIVFFLSIARWVNEPAIILFGYLLLFMIAAQTPGSLFQAGLSTTLALFGSGFSLLAVLLPRPDDLDLVERAALAGCLSLAIGGILGFLLSQSPWGLHLSPYLIVAGLFSLGCYIIVVYRQWNLAEGDKRISSRTLAKLIKGQIYRNPSKGLYSKYKIAIKMVVLGNRGDLTNEQWVRIEPLLPKQKTQRGGPAQDHRKLLNGMIWALQTGAPWRDMPERYGKWTTIYSRFRRWRKSGVWDKMHGELQTILDVESNVD